MTHVSLIGVCYRPTRCLDLEVRTSTRVIHVVWEGPFSREEAERDFTDRAKHQGVYQVYGSHVVYGPHTLLYIGQTERQTFSSRLHSENWAGWETPQGRVEFYLGRLSGVRTPSKARWAQEIRWVEALLIAAHSPAHNKTGVQYLPAAKDQETKDLHVLNWGNYGSLLPEVSGARWGSKYDQLADHLYGDAGRQSP